LGFESGEAGLLWPPTLAPQLLPDAVENGLPQLGVQRPGTPGFELPDPLKRLKEGFLDKVVGIGHIARPAGQSAGRPSSKRPDVAGEQTISRILIARSGAFEQLKRRLRLRLVVVHLHPDF
jgi:hypothetical protein